MPRPTKPTAVLEQTGAFRHDPQRARVRKHEPQPKGPLGPAPKHLNKGQQACWRELSRIAPPRVLTVSDRWLVEITARLMAKLRNPRARNLTASEMTQLTNCLARMGLTPTDRTKVSVPEPEKTGNLFAELAATPPPRYSDDDDGPQSLQ